MMQIPVSTHGTRTESASSYESPYAVGSATPGRARVLHIEDDPLAAEFVRNIVCRWGNCEYLGCAVSGKEGLVRCAELKPAVVLLDLCLPDIDGLEVLGSLHEAVVPCRVIILTVRVDEALLYNLLRGRAAGCVIKSLDLRVELRAAFEACRCGQSFVSLGIADALSRFRCDPNAFFKVLSDCEIALLQAFARGKSDQEIARRSGASPETIHSHRQSVMRKLDLHTSVALMRWCAQHGFLAPNSSGLV